MLVYLWECDTEYVFTDLSLEEEGVKFLLAMFLCLVGKLRRVEVLGALDHVPEVPFCLGVIKRGHLPSL